MHIVVCEDGAIRHASPFETKAEARHFAVWGHCCTKDHVITGINFIENVAEVVFAVSNSQIPNLMPPQGLSEPTWIAAEELRAEDVILLPFGRTVAVRSVTAVGSRWVRFTTESGPVELTKDTKVYVERRN